MKKFYAGNSVTPLKNVRRGQRHRKSFSFNFYRFLFFVLKFVCLFSPFVVLFVSVITTFSTNLMFIQKFQEHALDSVRSVSHSELHLKVENFFERKLEIVRKLESDVRSGDYGDHLSLSEFQTFVGTNFRNDEDLFSVYLANNGGIPRTFKVHRENTGYITVNVREYRYDYLIRPEDPFSNDNMTNWKKSLYFPWLRSWYICANESYPLPCWEGPFYFSTPFAQTVENRKPHVGYSRKIVWRNESIFSLFRLKIKIEKINEFVTSLEENYLKLLIINQDYTVVGYRDLSLQYDPVKKEFKKIWEMEDEDFGHLTQEFIQKNIKRGKSSKYFHQEIEDIGWTVIYRFKKGTYTKSKIPALEMNKFHVYFSNFLSAVFMVSLMFSVLYMLYVMMKKNRKKSKELKMAKEFSHAIATLNLNSPKIESLLKRKKLNELESSLVSVMRNMILYKQFLPQSIYANFDGLKNERNKRRRERIPESRASSLDELSSTTTGSESSFEKSTLNSVFVNEGSLNSNNFNTIEDHISNFGGLNISHGVMMVVNLRNFSSFYKKYLTRGMKIGNVTKFCSIYIEEICKIIKKNKGIVNSTQVDKIVCSWNVNTKFLHFSEFALMTACEINAAFEEVIVPKWIECGFVPLKLSIGIAENRCFCGVFGMEYKMNCVFGDLTKEVYFVEKLNKEYSTTILCTDDVYEKGRYFGEFRIIDFVRIGEEKRKIYECLTFTSGKKGGGDEWLVDYVESDRFSLYHKACRLLYEDKNADEAKKVLLKFLELNPQYKDDHSKRLMEKIEKKIVTTHEEAQQL